MTKIVYIVTTIYIEEEIQEVAEKAGVTVAVKQVSREIPEEELRALVAEWEELPGAPEIVLLQLQILIVRLLQNLLFVGKLQQMVGLIKLVVPRIHKILLALWFTVVAVRHHQVPVDVFLHHILGSVKGVLALSNIFCTGNYGRNRAE